LYAGLAIILYGIRYAVFGTEAPGYLMAIECNCWIFGIFGFGYKYLNKPSKTLNYLSKAAYPVYIIHMFVLYAAALFILPLELPIMLKFLAIVSFTGLVCYLIYEFIIRRLGFLKAFFGLKWEFNKLKYNSTSKKEELNIKRPLDAVLQKLSTKDN
jgi:peptidoglycan/LPS O-acetylase OafA/YrhL